MVNGHLQFDANSIQIHRTTEANGVVTETEPVVVLLINSLRSVLLVVLITVLWKHSKMTQLLLVLPLESFHGHVVTILNSSTAEDDYYLKFVADNGVGGSGYWEETRARDSSPGIDNATMPMS